MGFLKNIQNGSNWNIGFSSLTPEELINSKKIGKIKWMKHNFRDRFFADPFIYNVSDDEIIVFAEEYIFDNPPGLIVELVIDKNTFRLKKRYELLRLNTHLSYPAIWKENGIVYVYPENGESGKLNIYRYDSSKHKLVEPKTILNEAVADATALRVNNNKVIIVATKYPKTQEGAYLYVSDSILGPFKIYSHNPLEIKKEYSRPAGNFIEYNGRIFRPAQNCLYRYGGSTSVMDINLDKQNEIYQFEIKPTYFRYPLGLHTINFHKDLCVVDGYGYLYPILGRIYASSFVNTIRNFVKKILAR